MHQLGDIVPHTSLIQRRSASIRRSQLAMTADADAPSRSRGVKCPRFWSARSALLMRGRGESRVPIAPMGPVQKKHGGRTTGSTGIIRPSPHNGLRLIPCSPQRSAFLPLSPPGSLLPGNLMPAPGHQDHTVLPSALAPFVKSASASIASSPASVTIAIRPSGGVDGASSTLIWVF